MARKRKTAVRANVPRHDIDRADAQEGVRMVAVQNTQLPDGRYVAEGKEVVVSNDYAAAVEASKRPHFRRV